MHDQLMPIILLISILACKKLTTNLIQHDAMIFPSSENNRYSSAAIGVHWKIALVVSISHMYIYISSVFRYKLNITMEI
jgi:hypothetical protein